MEDHYISAHIGAICYHLDNENLQTRKIIHPIIQCN